MLFDIRHDADKKERRKGNIQQESHGRTHFRAAPFQLYTRFEVSDAGQVSAAQLRLAATHLYPLRRISIIPGIFEIHTSGRPHQISRASATAASAPPNRLPSLRRNCISRINSSRDNPSSAPTRGSCSGASAMPRRSRIGASHRAMRVQNLHSASKNSHPRACRPFPSVYSLTSEIISSLLPYFLVPSRFCIVTSAKPTKKNKTALRSGNLFCRRRSCHPRFLLGDVRSLLCFRAYKSVAGRNHT